MAAAFDFGDDGHHHLFAARQVGKEATEEALFGPGLVGENLIRVCQRLRQAIGVQLWSARKDVLTAFFAQFYLCMQIGARKAQIHGLGRPAVVCPGHLYLFQQIARADIHAVAAEYGDDAV